MPTGELPGASFHSPACPRIEAPRSSAAVLKAPWELSSSVVLVAVSASRSAGHGGDHRLDVDGVRRSWPWSEKQSEDRLEKQAEFSRAAEVSWESAWRSEEPSWE